jgi:hypothetical protein
LSGKLKFRGLANLLQFTKGGEDGGKISDLLAPHLVLSPCDEIGVVGRCSVWINQNFIFTISFEYKFQLISSSLFSLPPLIPIQHEERNS